MNKLILVSIAVFVLSSSLLASNAIAPLGGGEGITRNLCATNADCAGRVCTTCYTPVCSSGVCTCAATSGPACGTYTVSCTTPFCSGNSQCIYPVASASCTQYCSGGVCASCSPNCGSPYCYSCGADSSCSGGSCNSNSNNAGCASCADAITLTGSYISKTCGIACSGPCTGSCPYSCAVGSTTCSSNHRLVCQSSTFLAQAISSYGGTTCSQASINPVCQLYTGDQGCDSSCGAVCSSGQTQSQNCNYCSNGQQCSGGTQTSTCDSGTCTWGTWSTCVNNPSGGGSCGCSAGQCGAICSTGQTLPCTVNGLPGTQSCTGSCQWGSCIADSCKYSLSLNPAFQSDYLPSQTWTITATDSSNSLCTSPINYTIVQSTVGNCVSTTVPSSILVTKGGSSQFSVSASTSSSAYCILDITLKGPNSNTAATGEYVVGYSDGPCTTPGQTQNQACSYCSAGSPTSTCTGTQPRYCQSNNAWGPWGPCSNANCVQSGCTPPANCGDSCNGGLWNPATSNCYRTYATSCTLNGTAPAGNRIWVGSSTSPRPSGVYQVGASSVCSSNSCAISPNSLTIGGTFTNITYPIGPGNDTNRAYKPNDNISIVVSGISTTNSWTPLVECRMSVYNSTGQLSRAMYFDSWSTGTVAFQYNTSSSDPSGLWTVDYCGIWTDFVVNGGVSLEFHNNTQQGGSPPLKVSTSLLVT